MGPRSGVGSLYRKIFLAPKRNDTQVMHPQAVARMTTQLEMSRSLAQFSFIYVQSPQTKCHL
jgi:hypothetical protein